MSTALIRRPSKIVDHNGRALSINLYASPRSNSKAYRPRQPLSPDYRQNVTEHDRKELVEFSRQLRARVDTLDTAIEQKNNWAFGDAWEPHYTGETHKWTEEASEFLVQQFYPNCNVRGPQFDMRTSLKLMGQAWDVDGDDLMVLTETESHFPQLAFYPSTRVATRPNGMLGKVGVKGETVEGGPFDGLEIFDGIIYNRHSRMVGCRIVNHKDGTYQDVSAFNADLGFEPKWCDQTRGIPRIAVSLLRWMNMQDIDEFIQKSVKRASSVGIIIENEEGEAGVGNEVITGEESPTVPEGEREVSYEEIHGGEAYYLTAGRDEKITALDYKNPHPNTEAFIQRLHRGALNSVGWHYDLLNPGESGRAGTRLLSDLANQTIWDRQSAGIRRWKRIIGYALAKAAKHGFISKPPSPLDYSRWEPGLPKQISVDAGNDTKAQIEKIKFGLSTASIEASKDGYHMDYISREQERELKRVVAMANNIYPLVKDKGMSYEAVLQMCRQTSPNPVNQQQQAEPAKE